MEVVVVSERLACELTQASLASVMLVLRFFYGVVLWCSFSYPYSWLARPALLQPSLISISPTTTFRATSAQRRCRVKMAT